MRVYDDPSKMPAVDLVVITLKSTENHHLARLLPPLLHNGTTILTLQNGLGNEQALAELFGAQRVVGGIAFVCINRVAPGVIHHLDSGYVRVAEFARPGRSPRVERIVEMFNAARVRASAIDDLKAGRWDKLAWNVPFNGLGAMLDLTTDRLLTSKAGTAAVTGVIREVMAAAKADGVVLPADTPEKKIAVTRAMGAYKTSTQIDRRTGRPMEIESLFARPVRVAREAGVAVPLMELIWLALAEGSTEIHGQNAAAD
jgi:2-dehydropantoate 2-reductase